MAQPRKSDCVSVGSRHSVATRSGWARLEIGADGASLETWDAAPQAGYANYTYTGTSLLGSLAFRYNASAGAANYHFLPSGLEWPGEGQDATTNLRWGGHENDAESGLYHFLYRNYSPLEKRWLSPDPAGWAVGDPADPQSWDRYAYAEGSPCSTTDPLGLKDCPPGTKPLTAAQGQAVVAAAQQIVASKAYAYGEGNTVAPTPGSPYSGKIDCTHFLQLAMEQAGLVIPYESTAMIRGADAADLQVIGGQYYLPAPGPAPGEALLLNAGGGPETHALLSAGGDVFFASNSPDKRDSIGGPSEVGPGQPHNSGGPYWAPRIAAGHYYIPCVKDTPRATAGMGGGGGLQDGLPDPYAAQLEQGEEWLFEFILDGGGGSAEEIWSTINYIRNGKKGG